MQTCLPYINYGKALPSPPCSSAKANSRTYPRTYLDTLIHWDSFPNDVHNAIHSAMTQLDLSSEPFHIQGLTENTFVEGEEKIRAHAIYALHRPVERVVTKLGLEGAFLNPGSGNTAIVGSPNFSWITDPVKKPHPKLVVEYKPWWAADLTHVPDAFQGTACDSLSKQSLEALEQVYGYMSFNDNKFGILTNWKRALFLRRAETPDRKSLEYYLLELESSSPSISMLKAWVGMVLLAHDASPTSPPNRYFRDSLAGQKAQQRAVRNAEDYWEFEFPTDGTYKHQLLDFRLCKFDLSSAQYGERAGGCIVWGGLLSDTECLDVVFKVVDVCRYPDAPEFLQEEADAYAALYDLQGQVIPKVYGLYEIWGILHVLALQSVGDAISEDEPIDRTLLKKMKFALQRIHHAGFLHGNITCSSFCRTKSGEVFLVDLKRCRSSKNQAEFTDEMVEVDALLEMEDNGPTLLGTNLRIKQVLGQKIRSPLISQKMSTTLPLFWHLSSGSKNERIDASVKLVSALEHFQSQFVQKAAHIPTADSSEDEEEEEDNTTKSKDDLDLWNTQDVSYSIRRLIRGLASPRESSRLGFAVALTELLLRLDTIWCSQILNLVIDSTKHQGSMKGQEERDILFARLFGIMSIIQSGLVVRTKPLPSSASSVTTASSSEAYEQIVNSLVTLGEQKSWLRESAWFTLGLATDALHESDVTWKEEAISVTLDALFVKYTIWSIEKLALALKLQNFYPAHDWNNYLSPTFKNADILSTANLATISRILKESETDEGTEHPTKAPSAGWKPSLNFAWDIILEQLLPAPNSKTRAKGSFQDFYKVVVDETLFSSTASPNRKYWGFQVFQKALKRADEEAVPMLFTKNFMRTWINHLSKKDRYLHKVSLQTATELQSFVKDKQQLGFALIVQLTGINGSQQFDKLTRTKTVESILSLMDANGVQTYIEHLLSQINENDVGSANVSTINTRRAWIIEQLASLVRNSKIPRNDAWITNVLRWFVIHGLFIIKKKASKSPFMTLRSLPRPVFSDELRRSCRDKLLSCLGDLGNQTSVITEGNATKKVIGAASDGEYWISKVLSIIQELEEDKKHLVLADEVDDEERALRLKTRETVAKLKMTATRQESARGAELLLLGTLLMRYCDAGDEESGELDALESCTEAASNLLLTDEKEKKIKPADEDSEEIEPIDLLVDIIISFLEKGTAYMRTIANQVFSLLTKSVKDTTIEVLLTQFELRDSSQLLNNEDEEMEEMEEHEEAVSGEEDSNSEGSSEESDGDDSGEDSNEEEVDLELRNKIEEALRVNGIEFATGETDSEEELMDDEQMMAIDEQLAEVFRSQANEKKNKIDLNVQREATHFKNRVLDLVETYFKKQPSNPLVLRLVVPLVELALGSGQDERQLGDKAKGILRACIGRSKENLVGADNAQVLEVSKTVHALARKARSSDNLAVISLCCTYLAKNAMHLDEDAIVDLYKQDLHDFATRKNSGLNGVFFQNFVTKYPSCAWRMRRDILDLSTKAINAYRQTQVIQILRHLLNLLQSFNPPVDEVTSFMTSLSQQLIELIETSCEATSHLTTAQMKEVLQLALLGIRQTARVAPNATTLIWKPEIWAEMNEKFSASPWFKSSPTLKGLCKRVADSCETPSSRTAQKQPKKTLSKRKAEELAEDSIPFKSKKLKAMKPMSK